MEPVPILATKREPSAVIASPLGSPPRPPKNCCSLLVLIRVTPPRPSETHRVPSGWAMIDSGRTRSWPVNVRSLSSSWKSLIGMCVLPTVWLLSILQSETLPPGQFVERHVTRHLHIQSLILPAIEHK